MGPRSHWGQISNRKMETHRARGTARQTASSEETTVPQMKGRAPKSPEFGSQELLVKNFHPKVCMDNFEFRIRTERMSSTIRKMLIAQTTIMPWKAPSANLPELLDCRNFRITEGGLITSVTGFAGAACSGRTACGSWIEPGSFIGTRSAFSQATLLKLYE